MRKLLPVRLPTELHTEIKKRAAIRNISMTLLVEKLLTEYVLQEKLYDDSK